jgi:DNA-binding LacI/PurR family transcriptional regulator
MKVTSMSEVGEYCGVSHQTVSRVLNGKLNVSAITRKKVLQAIEELGYQPNLIARSLARGKSESIGVLSYQSTLYGPASTLHSVQHAAQEKGYTVSLISLKTVTRNEINKGVQDFLNNGIAGIVIMLPQHSSNEIFDDFPEGLPAVLVEESDSTKLSTVTVDHYLGITTAIKHLVGLGHTQIAFISGPMDWLAARIRAQAWQETFRALGLSRKFNFHGDWSPKSGYRATLDILENPEITAILSANDGMALGVLKALSSKGIRVPDEMSVIGFDDVPEAEYFQPGLTTVRQPFDEVGRISLQLLISLIESEKSEKVRYLIPTELILRESTTFPRVTR